MAEKEELVAKPSYHDHLRCPIYSHYVPFVVPRPKADKTVHAVNRTTPFSSLLAARVVWLGFAQWRGAWQENANFDSPTVPYWCRP